MDTKYFKKFDLEHAKAGAPIGLRNGADAHIDHFFGSKLIGWFRGVSGEPFSAEWGPDGSHTFPGHEGRLDLVMRPSGMIEGKPAFVGDVVVIPSGEHCTIAPADRPGNDCTWPKPAPKWPVTTLTANELCDMDNAALHGFEGNAYIAFANRIIAHECEAGTLVPTDRLRPIVRGVLGQYGIDADGYALDAIITSVRSAA